MQKDQQALSLRLDTRPGRRDTAGEIGPRAAFTLLHLTSLESGVSHPIVLSAHLMSKEGLDDSQLCELWLRGELLDRLDKVLIRFRISS
jgi:hypothetical protein